MRSNRYLIPAAVALTVAISSSSSARLGVMESPAAADGIHALKTRAGDSVLAVGLLLQPRFETISYDEARDTDDDKTFEIRRAELDFTGHFAGEKNRFGVEIGVDGPSLYLSSRTSTGDFELLDGWVSREICPSLMVRAGQFKTPFSRQQMVYNGDLQLPDRSVAVDTLGFDARDVGLELSGAGVSNKLGWAAALVNSEGPNQLSPAASLALYGRLQFDPSGAFGDGEGDIAVTDHVVTSFGGAFHYQELIDQDDIDAKLLRLNFDAGVKAHGWSLHGEFFRTDVDSDTGHDFTNNSYYLQGGRFFPGHSVELVGRISGVLYDGDDNDAMEYTAGFNYYMKGQHLKWQGAYSLFDRDPSALKDHRLIAQGQVRF